MLNGPQERLVVDTEELAFRGIRQILKCRPDQRIAAAKVMIEERERAPNVKASSQRLTLASSTAIGFRSTP